MVRGKDFFPWLLVLQALCPWNSGGGGWSVGGGVVGNHKLGGRELEMSEEN